MLNCARDATGNVELWRHGLARTSDLVLLGEPTSVGHRAGRTHSRAESLGQVEDNLKFLLVRQASAASHYDICLSEIDFPLCRMKHFEDLTFQPVGRQWNV